MPPALDSVPARRFALQGRPRQAPASHRRFAVVRLALAALVALALAVLAAPAAFAVNLAIAVAEAPFLDLLNADRVAAGLHPLQPDPRLMEVARWRSEDLVARNYFSHDIGGFTISRVLVERQIEFDLVGENLVLNTFDEASTVRRAHADLMASFTHRANVLRPDFQSVGVGIATGPNNQAVFTQIFVKG
jgi:uncharacterized protein YkwD